MSKTGSTHTISRKLEVCTDGEEKGRNGGECYTACEKNEAAIDEGDDAGTSATTRI